MLKFYEQLVGNELQYAKGYANHGKQKELSISSSWDVDSLKYRYEKWNNTPKKVRVNEFKLIRFQ